MKKIIITKSGCNEFGNELLNLLSIYAVGFELDIEVINHSGFGLQGVQRLLHRLYARVILALKASHTVHAWRAPVYLPPTKVLSATWARSSNLYLFGWLYRNAEGLAKHRKKLLEIFTPTSQEAANIEQLVSKQKHRTLIAVHLRQKPFRDFPAGEFLIPVEEVEVAVDTYVRIKKLSPLDVALIIVSDLPLPKPLFQKYTTVVACGNTRMNLFLMSKGTVVIGTNTTFSNLASWFGNVPHVVTTPEEIDWAYYQDKETYFDNVYATYALG